MPITISGSTGIAGVDGSASTPAVQGTDTNTGITFPAADTVAIGTGGTERMRVDSSGNVGIGTSSPAQKLDVSGNVNISGALIPSSSFLRNRIINGAFDVWQRGTSFASPTNITYLADRWFVGVGGSSPASAVQVTGPAGFQYALQVTGAAGNSTIQINQRIESVNTYDLVGQSVAIQAVIQVSSAQTVQWGLYRPNSKDNFNSLSLITSDTWSATTTATRFTATAANMPAQVANGLMLLLSPNNGGAFTSGTITVAGVQLEAGPFATPFERRLFGQELYLCQRYFQTASPKVAGYSINQAQSLSSWIPFQCQMRASPIMTYSNITFINASGLSSDTVNSNGFIVQGTVSAAGAYAASFTFTASAEL